MKRIVLLLLALFSPLTATAAISGPAEVELGTLAVFQSDLEGTATLATGKGNIAIDSNGRTVYFATPKEGEYTLLFFGLRNGKPDIASHTFVVGKVAPAPTPTPTPEPEVKLTDTERSAVLTAVRSVLAGIEAGTIRTPQGARAAFKNVLVSKVGSCSINGCTLPNSVNVAIKTWESGMDITTMDGLKAGFAKIEEELK